MSAQHTQNANGNLILSYYDRNREYVIIDNVKIEIWNQSIIVM